MRRSVWSAVVLVLTLAATADASAQRRHFDERFAVAVGVGIPYGYAGVAATTRALYLPLTFTTGFGIQGIGLGVNVVWDWQQRFTDLGFLGAAVALKPWEGYSPTQVRGIWSIEIGGQTDVALGRGQFLEYGFGVMKPFWENEAGWVLFPTLRGAVGFVF